MFGIFGITSGSQRQQSPRDKTEQVKIMTSAEQDVLNSARERARNRRISLGVSI